MLPALRSSRTFLIVLSLIGSSFLAVLPQSSAYAYPSSLDTANAWVIGDLGGGHLGWSVSVSGDLDKDGYDDLVIGTYDGDGVYIFYGKASGWNKGMAYSDANAHLWGKAGMTFGSSLEIVGDINGDGCDDLAIGQHYWPSYSGPSSGKVYLIYGSTTRLKGTIEVATFSTSTLIGSIPGEHLGIAVWGGGDVNGDGLDDILIGADQNSQFGQFSGMVYLVPGIKEKYGKDINISKAALASFHGTYLSLLGNHPSKNGDFNGDGLTDILIPCTKCDGNGNQMGTVSIFMGKKTGWALDTSILDADASYSGVVQFGVTGDNRISSSVGDVNGDGYDDFVASYYTYSGNSGAIYLIQGKSFGWARGRTLQEADHIWISSHGGDMFGAAVSDAGDVDGDGLADFLVGAVADEDPNHNFNAGKTFLFLGKDHSSWVYGEGAIVSANRSYEGAQNYDDSGVGLSGAGDVNGDGLDDIAIGATQRSKDGVGKAYLIFPEYNRPPLKASNLTFFSDESCTKEILNATMGQRVYLELKAEDQNSTHIDIARISISSNWSDPKGYQLNLKETGTSTGVFRGNLTIKEFSNPSHRWIGASIGELVNATFGTGVNGSIIVGPVNYRITTCTMWTTYEDLDGLCTIEYDGPQGLDVVIDTLPPWKEVGYNSSNRTLWGRPINSDVGLFQTNATLRMGKFTFDRKQINITVLNTPPQIITEYVNSTLVGEPYYVDYNSTDDGQGNITWYLGSSDARVLNWFSMGKTTGVLTGSPMAAGRYPLNISVNDGNGGTSWSNFSLDAKNIPQPKIQIIYPSNNETVNGTFIMNGTIWQDPLDPVISLIYRVTDGAGVKFEPKANWSIKVGPLSPGPHTIQLEAWTHKGAKILLNLSVHVISSPPTIDIIDPIDKQNVSGILMINGTASDDQELTVGDLYINGTQYLPFRIINGTWGISVNVSSYALGPLMIEVRVKDLDNWTALDKITVNVVKKVIPPVHKPTLEVLIISPTNGQKIKSEFNLTFFISYNGTGNLSLEIKLNKTVILTQEILPGQLVLKIVVPKGMKNVNVSVRVNDTTGLSDSDSVPLLGPDEIPPPVIPRKHLENDFNTLWILLAILVFFVCIAILMWLYSRKSAPEEVVTAEAVEEDTEDELEDDEEEIKEVEEEAEGPMEDVSPEAEEDTVKEAAPTEDPHSMDDLYIPETEEETVDKIRAKLDQYHVETEHKPRDSEIEMSGRKK